MIQDPLLYSANKLCILATILRDYVILLPPQPSYTTRHNDREAIFCL